MRVYDTNPVAVATNPTIPCPTYLFLTLQRTDPVVRRKTSSIGVLLQNDVIGHEACVRLVGPENMSGQRRATDSTKSQVFGILARPESSYLTLRSAIGGFRASENSRRGPRLLGQAGTVECAVHCQCGSQPRGRESVLLRAWVALMNLRSLRSTVSTCDRSSELPESITDCIMPGRKYCTDGLTFRLSMVRCTCQSGCERAASEFETSSCSDR